MIAPRDGIDQERTASGLERGRRSDDIVAGLVGVLDCLGAARDLQSVAVLMEQVGQRLAKDDVVCVLPDELQEGYLERLLAARTNLAALVTLDGLQRAQPYLRRLEERVRTDPFAGLTSEEVLRTRGELSSLRSLVLHEIRNVPVDDPDVISIDARLAAARKRIEQADVARATARAAAYVADYWNTITPEFEGWWEESVGADRDPLEPPSLPLTSVALTQAGQLLADPQLLEIRHRFPEHPTIETTFLAAEEVQETACLKLHFAFNQAMDEAEQVPVVARENECDLANVRAFLDVARRLFEDTTFLAGNVKRAQQLNDRWEEEIAATPKARQDLQNRPAGEAAARWPAIVAVTGAATDFDRLGCGRSGAGYRPRR